jgi:hypothetical protein
VICIRRIAVVSLFCALAVGTFGCGDDDPMNSPYEGVYQVDSHTENNDGCDAEGDAIDDDDIFKLGMDEWFGTRFLAYYDCTSADECEDSISLFGSFYERSGDGWVGEGTSWSYFDGTCNVSLSEGKLNFDDGDSIRIERRRYSGELTVDNEDECDEDLIEEHRDDLVCDSLEVIIASPVD